MNDNVAEAPGANLFFEKDGKLFTPAKGNILPGITRATVIDICAELNIEVEEKFFGLDELRSADTVFYCGTAAEVIGWESLDDQPLAKPWVGSLAQRIQKAYKNLVIDLALEPKQEIAELV